MAFIVQFGLGLTFALLSKPLVSLIVGGGKAVEYGVTRLTILGLGYVSCGIMETLANSVRAMGKPMFSLFVSVFGAVVVRIVFLEVAFIFLPYFSTIFFSYLVSWSFTVIIYLFVVPKVYKGLKNQF